MVNKKYFMVAICLIAVIVGGFFFFKEHSSLSNVENRIDNASLNYQDNISPKKIKTKAGNPTFSNQPNKSHLSKNVDEKILFLNSDNFESMSEECFQGTPCEVEGDPWAQYQALKKEAKKGVTDLYIAFLRKKMSDPKFKDQYKDMVKKMIKDFYPDDQMDFQMAAYYNYLGDLEASLKMYLALEKKSQMNPKIFSAPKLNIANTYYDLGRLKQALAYYQASLNDQKSTQTDDSVALINFINDRIELIREKLRHNH
jgi:tetratricopeptide (TPR) repeat protein